MGDRRRRPTSIDSMFHFCSFDLAMSRVDDPTLSLHLEVALSTAPPALLDGLTDSDRRRRHAAVGEIVRQLVDRLRCFDIRTEQENAPFHHPSLFSDIGPLG